MLAEPTTALLLKRMSRPARSLEGLAWAAGGLGSVLAILGAAAWLAKLGWFDPPYWVLVAWAAAMIGALVVGRWVWRNRGRVGLKALARALETHGVGRRGTLTALLETPAPGTSSDLFRLADLAQAKQLERQGEPAFRAQTKAALTRAGRGGGVLLVGLLLLASAGPLGGRAAALWDPGVAWKATTAPVTIEASQLVVNRGDSVALSLEAMGREQALLMTRVPGETWRSRSVTLDQDGHATIWTGPLEHDLHAKLMAGTRSSETVTIEVRPPAFLGMISVTAEYPSYLGLANEPLPTNGDTILLPAGTRLATAGQATAALGEAAWALQADRFPLEVSQSSFEGRFVPRRSGVYRLQLTTAAGAPLAGDPVGLSVRVVADSVPVIEVPVPGRDTILPVTLRMPIVVDAHDDHGLRTLRLVSRRISRLGIEAAPVTEPLALPAGAPDRAIVSHTFDATRRGLLPGDTIRYYVEATDNAPRQRAARSAEYVLRLLTMQEIRAAARAATSDVQERLDSLVAQSRDIERRTEDLSRERLRRDEESGGQPGRSLSFEEAKRAEAAAKAQEQLLQDAEGLRDALEALRESAEAAGLDDPDWLARLEEIREQLDRALTEELKAKLAELQQALQNLDADRAKEALKRLAEAQSRLREVLERSRELFRRAALEGDLARVGDEARELADRQAEWNQRVDTTESGQAAREERDIARATDSLAAALEQLAEALEREGLSEEIGELSREAGEAAEQMRSAAEQADKGNPSNAERAGQLALDKLRPVGDRLDSERQNIQMQWRDEVAQALDRGLAETSRLTERQLAVEEAIQGGAPTERVLADQAALDEGVEKLIEQMLDVAGKNALVSPAITGALAEAQLHMRRSREAMASAMPDTREGAGRAGQAVDALNAAAYHMLRSRDDVVGAGSASGLAEALERLNQLAQQQGQLGQASGGLLPMAGGGALQEELRRLAREQRRLAQELERLRAGGQLPNTGALADEAENLARRLEAGRLDRQTVERQQRLFRRMLDAGRTLEGREEDEQKERQSEAARGDSVHIPAALRALLEGTDQVQLPSWDELQRLSPEERRLVVEYFRRISEPAP